MQVRVVQGKEPPCFLNLFGGRMIVHSGKREGGSSSSGAATWRMFGVCNELAGELGRRVRACIDADHCYRCYSLQCFDAVGWVAGRGEGHPACKKTEW